MFNGTLKVGNEYELNNGEVFECKGGWVTGYTLRDRWYIPDGRWAKHEADHPLSVRQCVKGTLADIDVKPGDVVDRGGYVYTYEGSGYASAGGNKNYLFPLSSDACYRLISRATDDCDKPNGGGMVGIGINLGRGPTLFRDMTDAEKGALLLAQHRGYELQALAVDHDCSSWVNKTKLPFYSHIAYRIKPEPTTETRTLYMGADMRNALEYGSADDACKLHYDIIDGKPCNPRFEAIE